MKKQYIQPCSEQLPVLLNYSLLEDSLVDTYGGEDSLPVDGNW